MGAARPAREALTLKWKNCAVFVAVAAVYGACPVKGPGDLFWSLPTVASILREGNAGLDEYAPAFHHYPGAIEQVGGRPRNFFPIGSTLVALAPIWLFDKAVSLVAPISGVNARLAKGVGNWKREFHRTGEIDPSFFFTTELVLASLLMALAALFIQLAAAELLPWKWALCVTAVFAFGSPVFSTASRDLGQHGPSVLMISVALWLLVRARREPGGVRWAGLFVAASYLMRPTNSLAVVAISAFVFFRYRRWFAAYCACAAAVLVPFFLYNFSVYSALLPTYYRPDRIIPASAALFLEAAAGNLVSPARGLLVFSPVFLLSGWGLALAFARVRLEAGLVAALLVAHWLVVSSFPHWWAGHSYGPRYMTDLTPWLCLLLVPVLLRLRETKRWPLGVALALLFAWSGFTHLRGATSWAAVGWNATPRDVDANPDRLWDFADPPFLRGG